MLADCWHAAGHPSTTAYSFQIPSTPFIGSGRARSTGAGPPAGAGRALARRSAANRTDVDRQHGPQERLGGLGAGHRALRLGVPGCTARRQHGRVRASRGGRRCPSPGRVGEDCLTDLGGDPNRVVIGGYELGRGARQDERAGAVGPGPDEEQGRAGQRPFGQDGGAL